MSEKTVDTSSELARQRTEHHGDKGAEVVSTTGDQRLSDALAAIDDLRQMGKVQGDEIASLRAQLEAHAQKASH